MALTLPYNALVKLTSLNTQTQRNVSSINGYRVSSGSTILYVNSVYGITTQNDIVLSGMSGISDGTYDISNVNTTNQTLTIATTPSWSIAGVRSYRIQSGNSSTYYNSYIINGTHSLNAGDSVNISVSGVNWLITGSQTVQRVTNTQVIVTLPNQSTNINFNYPQLSTSQYATPTVTGTITQSATPGTTVRATGLDNTSWGIASGANYLWLSDHNRDSLETSFEDIEYSVRTADGTMRRSHTASKRSFSLKWSLLPADTDHTVDGYAGGEALRQLYINNAGSFNMEVYNRTSARKNSSPDQIIPVRIKDFSYSIVKRGVEYGSGQLTDFWDVDLNLEEV